ncbi:MAG: hypothetical protein K2W95_11890 [Candidatus Obscuribacterales bacterium]|nr:hypothetical protein [Candidatus Obscuribacterales bacterium]
MHFSNSRTASTLLTALLILSSICTESIAQTTSSSSETAETTNEVSTQPGNGSVDVSTSGSAPQETPPDAAAKPQKIAVASERKLKLKGGVTETLSPFKADGSVETIKQGKALSITLSTNLNSELAQEGDDIYAMVSTDVKDGKKVLLPGQWKVHGKVTKVEKRRRGGLDGYVEIKFDQLISPDGKLSQPFEATVSTKDSAPKAIAKHLVKDTGYVSVGAVGGALMSVQLTGIPLAVATNGYSVAIGAAAGATLGAVAAGTRKGKIMSILPGDELKLTMSKPVVLPAFNPEALPSAAPPEVTEGVELFINNCKKLPDPYGDKHSCLLRVNFKFSNKTEKRYDFSDLTVISNRNQNYLPFTSMADIKETSKSVAPHSVMEGTITFHVGSPKYKYSLALMDKAKSKVLSRIPLN